MLFGCMSRAEEGCYPINKSKRDERAAININNDDSGGDAAGCLFAPADDTPEFGV